MEQILFPTGLLVFSAALGFFASKNEVGRRMTSYLFGLLVFVSLLGFIFAIINRGNGWTGIIFGYLSYIIILFALPAFLFTLPWKKWFNKNSLSEASGNPGRKLINWTMIISPIVFFVFFVAFIFYFFS